MGKCRRYRQKRPTTGDLTEDDAYALFGNVVLDPARSGAAREGRIKPEFAGWVLWAIRDHLRPCHLVCFGMKAHRDAARLLEQTFDGFERARPDREHPFHSYKRSELTFQEWDVEGPRGNKTTIVPGPQHPRRAPFSRFDIWQAASQEFAERHGVDTRP